MLNNENVDPNATRLLIQSYYLWVGLAQEVAISLARFAGLAALVLCCLSVRNAARKLVMWAWIPGGIAVIGFPAFLIATAQRRNAALDAFATAVNLPLPTEHTWSAPLGQGIYLVAAGLAVLAVALKLFRKGLISLPLSFRGTSEAETGTQCAELADRRGIRFGNRHDLLCSFGFMGWRSCAGPIRQGHGMGFSKLSCISLDTRAPCSGGSSSSRLCCGGCKTGCSPCIFCETTVSDLLVSARDSACVPVTAEVFVRCGVSTLSRAIAVASVIYSASSAHDPGSLHYRVP